MTPGTVSLHRLELERRHGSIIGSLSRQALLLVGGCFVVQPTTKLDKAILLVVWNTLPNWQVSNLFGGKGGKGILSFSGCFNFKSLQSENRFDEFGQKKGNHSNKGHDFSQENTTIATCIIFKIAHKKSQFHPLISWEIRCYSPNYDKLIMECHYRGAKLKPFNTPDRILGSQLCTQIPGGII